VLKAGAVLGAVVAGGIQLVPYGRDHDNPPVVADAPWPDDESRRLAVAACYDCHSNETDWPWYSNVAPMSWLTQRDVDRGRDELNFSEWGSQDVDDLHDAVEHGEMPPWQYTLNHPEAKLSDAETERLVEALEVLEDGADADEDSEAGSEEPAGDGDNSGPGSRNSGRGSG
jgi:hypothetical protein